MARCKDRDLGALIHAYELNALSTEDARRFEIHIMKCEYCFNEVKDFTREAILLSSDEAVKDIISKASTGFQSESESALVKFLRYVWPDKPIAFKPAIAYLLILLMILPAYHGLRTMRENKIRSVKTVNFFPDRSIQEEALSTSMGSEVLISFVFRGAVPGEAYNVKIEDEDGSLIYEKDEFTGFDEYETARLILPLSQMEPGNYRLTVINPRSEAPSNKQEYRFRVKK
ncbi:MAG: zf-HC2 domain-containing protein [Candidatus Glassbacteria bacterium]